MTDRTQKEAESEAAVLEKIAAWPPPYREMGERIHRIILETAPNLRAKLWYGMPGYAKGGPVLLFFRVDDYMTFGLTEKANLSVAADAEDQLIDSAWFLRSLDAATEKRIAAIVAGADG